MPINYKVIYEGLKLGLNYILMFDPQGQCPFLKGNLCSIHELKPLACQKFPFDEKGQVRLVEHILKVCKGLIRSEEL